MCCIIIILVESKYPEFGCPVFSKSARVKKVGGSLSSSLAAEQRARQQDTSMKSTATTASTMNTTSAAWPSFTNRYRSSS